MCFSLEMLDKVEPPQIPIGYGISVAYACLLDIIRSIALAINGTREENAESHYKPTEFEQKLHVQLITSSWCGLLAALSPLIDARYSFIVYYFYDYSYSPDSLINIVKHFQY